jgi:hypothetical protein
MKMADQFNHEVLWPVKILKIALVVAGCRIQVAGCSGYPFDSIHPFISCILYISYIDYIPT